MKTQVPALRACAEPGGSFLNAGEQERPQGCVSHEQGSSPN